LSPSKVFEGLKVFQMTRQAHATPQTPTGCAHIGGSHLVT